MKPTTEELHMLLRLASCSFAATTVEEVEIQEKLLQDLTTEMCVHGAFVHSIREYEDQPFASKLFLGSGKHSEAAVNTLHKRLGYAITLLGGLQQPGHPESEQEAKDEEKYFEEGNRNLKEILKDIITAFGFEPKDLNDV